MKKQLLGRLFAGLAIMAVSSVSFFNLNAANGTFGGGDGSPETPFLVEDADDLNAVRNDLTASYKLIDDIDLTEWIAANSPVAGWDPIGNASYFKGNFDGNGKTVSGIWIDRKTVNGVGLFGIVCGSYTVTIKDLGVIIDETKSIAGEQCVGGILGKVTNTDGTPTVTIEGCYVKGKITAEVVSAGGIIGYSTWGRLTIKNCYAEGEVSGNDSSGGIIGQVYGAYTYNIQNCYATNTVSSISTKAAAGIIGSIGYGGNANSLAVNITNSIAANPSVSGAAASTSRIAGYLKTDAVAKTTYTDNMALSGMLVNGTAVSGGAADNKTGLEKAAKELATQATYAGWDFENTWTMGNGTYPFPVLAKFSTTLQPSTFPANALYAYTVDVTTSVSGAGGLISASETGLTAGNNTVTITLTPDENMKVTSLLVNGIDKIEDVSENQYVLTDIIGDYTVEATFDTATGISNASVSGISAFVNSAGQLMISGKSADVSAYIFDCAGRSVAVTQSSQFDLSSFAKGVYIVKIQGAVVKVFK